MTGPASSRRQAAPSPETAAPGDRRRRGRAVKREAVLAVAAEMFAEKGFRATSLDEVAARLGVTKPTLYRYVSSKDEILFDCAKRGLKMIHDAAEAGAGEGRSGRDRLEVMMRRYALAMTQDYCRCVTRTSDTELSEESRKEFRRLKREIDEALRAVVREGMEDGSLRKGDVRLTTFALTGALNWIGRWFEPGREMTPETVAEGVVGTLLAGLAPETPPPAAAKPLPLG